MPVSLYRKTRFSRPDYGSSYKEYLYGAIGSKVKANIAVQVSWSTEDVSMTFTASDGKILRNDGGSFLLDGFRDGDDIEIFDTSSNNATITNVTSVTKSIITTGASLTDESEVTCTIKGITPIEAIDFYPNLIENGSAFNLWNLTDIETMGRYSADTVSPSSGNPTIMQVTSNSKGWLSPAESVIEGTTSCNIYKDGALSTIYSQVFIINHTFTICPLYLANELSLLQRGLPQASQPFKDKNALKYVFKVDAKFDAFNADIPHTTLDIEFPNGQTGWYNEFINGRPTVYSKRFISYTDSDTNEELSSIDIGKTISASIGLRSPYMFNVDTSFILHLMYLPTNQDEYVNTATDYKTNFIYERCYLRNNGVVNQGENTGDYHFLKDVSATSINSYDAKIDFTVEFGTNLKAIIDGKDEKNYLVFVTFLDQNTNTSLIIDVNEYDYNKDDETLFQVIDEWQFYPYPHCESVGNSDFSGFEKDTIVSSGQFHVKKGSDDIPIILKEISANLIVTDGSNSFDLERFVINTSDFNPNFDQIQEIDFEQDRDFIIPEDDCRNTIQLFRMPTLDTATHNAYQFVYPFKIRWEYWRTLEGAFSQFIDPTERWIEYLRQAGWSLKFSIKSKVETNNNTTEFEHITWANIIDHDNTGYTIEFETYDETGGHNLSDVIAKDKITKVIATVDGDFSQYDISQLYGILGIDAVGIGGISYTLEIGTFIDVDENFAWYGEAGSRVAKLTKISDSQITLEAYINYEYLPKDTDHFILSARIGEYRVSSYSSSQDTSNFLMTDDGLFLMTDDGEYITID